MDAPDKSEPDRASALSELLGTCTVSHISELVMATFYLCPTRPLVDYAPLQFLARITQIIGLAYEMVAGEEDFTSSFYHSS